MDTSVLKDPRFWGGMLAGAGIGAGVVYGAMRASGEPRLTGKTTEELCIKEVFAKATKGDAASVLRTVDAFCWAGGWMMNIGDVKGQIVRQTMQDIKPRLMLEFGGYCGYSAVLIGSLLPEGGKLISIEINPVYAAIATKIIEFAGLAHKVSVHVGDVPDALHILAAEHGTGSVDAVFIDHWKDLYLRDLHNLENSHLLHVGSCVMADNIIYPGAPQYLEYVQTSPRYKTVLHESKLEYSTDRDAVAVSIVREI